MFKGSVTDSATKEFLLGHEVPPAFVRDFCGVSVSALAMGTYLGPMDFPTDHRVTQSVMRCIELGINFFDTAINYRGQRAERSLGDAFKRLFLTSAVTRESLFISTKGGFVPYEGEPTSDLVGLFTKQYVDTGLAKASDLVAGCHCLAPGFVRAQLNKSRQNLGLHTIDLYYLHNPETQFEELPARLVYQNMFQAFCELEKARSEGLIRHYGIATWDGLREVEESASHLSLEQVLAQAQKAAKQVGATSCGFTAVQMPLNLAMTEAASLRTQRFGGASLTMPAIEAAHSLGLSVAVSAPLYQGRILGDQPDFITRHFSGELTDAKRALLYALSTPGVGAAMVGMKQEAHLVDNAGVFKKSIMPLNQYGALVQSLKTRR